MLLLGSAMQGTIKAFIVTGLLGLSTQAGGVTSETTPPSVRQTTTSGLSGQGVVKAVSEMQVRRMKQMLRDKKMDTDTFLARVERMRRRLGK